MPHTHTHTRAVSLPSVVEHQQCLSAKKTCDSVTADESALAADCRGVSPFLACVFSRPSFSFRPAPPPSTSPSTLLWSPAVVVCGLPGGRLPAGPVPVRAVRPGLRRVLPGPGPLLHLGRTRLQSLHAHSAQVREPQVGGTSIGAGSPKRHRGVFPRGAAQDRHMKSICF